MPHAPHRHGASPQAGSPPCRHATGITTQAAAATAGQQSRQPAYQFANAQCPAAHPTGTGAPGASLGKLAPAPASPGSAPLRRARPKPPTAPPKLRTPPPVGVVFRSQAPSTPRPRPPRQPPAASGVPGCRASGTRPGSRSTSRTLAHAAGRGAPQVEPFRLPTAIPLDPRPLVAGGQRSVSLPLGAEASWRLQHEFTRADRLTSRSGQAVRLSRSRRSPAPCAAGPGQPADCFEDLADAARPDPARRFFTA